MRIVLAIAATAIIGWCGWWYLGATAQETALKAWLDGRKEAGWLAEYDTVAVAGFPNRIDSSVTELMLADPQSGWAWSAPLFQVLMLSYKPNHVIAVWPGAQKISTPYDTVTITSEQMRGSVVFVPDTALTLDRVRVELADVALAGGSWIGALESGNIATERLDPADAPDFAHAIGFEAKGLNLPDLARWVGRDTGILPDHMERAFFDVVAAFDGPWDRHAIEGEKPRLTVINIKEFEASWGPLNLKAQGKLDVDAAGYPVGDLQVSARNWRDMLTLATESGIVPRDLAGTLESGLNLLAMLSGGGADLNVPLSFSGGMTRLGPIPIGRAPKLTP